MSSCAAEKRPGCLTQPGPSANISENIQNIGAPVSMQSPGKRKNDAVKQNQQKKLPYVYQRQDNGCHPKLFHFPNHYQTGYSYR